MLCYYVHHTFFILSRYPVFLKIASPHLLNKNRGWTSVFCLRFLFLNIQDVSTSMLNSLFCEACLPAQGTFVRSMFFLFWRELEQNRAQNENIKWNFPEMEQRHLMQVNKVLQLHANVEIVNFKSWKSLLTEFKISNVLPFLSSWCWILHWS